MLFHQIAFVLAAQIHSPFCYRELEFLSVLHCLLKNFDSFSVGQAHEVFFNDRLQRRQQVFVNHLVEEFQIVFAVFQRPAHAEFDEILL